MGKASLSLFGPFLLLLWVYSLVPLALSQLKAIYLKARLVRKYVVLGARYLRKRPSHGRWWTGMCDLHVPATRNYHFALSAHVCKITFFFQSSDTYEGVYVLNAQRYFAIKLTSVLYVEDVCCFTSLC